MKVASMTEIAMSHGLGAGRLMAMLWDPATVALAIKPFYLDNWRRLIGPLTRMRPIQAAKVLQMLYVRPAIPAPW